MQKTGLYIKHSKALCLKTNIKEKAWASKLWHGRQFCLNVMMFTLAMMIICCSLSRCNMVRLALMLRINGYWQKENLKWRNQYNINSAEIKGWEWFLHMNILLKHCGLQILHRSTAEYVVFSKFYQSVNDDNSIRNEVNKFYHSFLWYTKQNILFDVVSKKLSRWF